MDDDELEKVLEKIRKEQRTTPEDLRPNEYRDEEILRRLYWDEGLDEYEISHELGCGSDTVRKWMDRLGIETREE